MDSKLAELGRLIVGWPGLVSDSSPELLADCLVLLPHLGDARRVVDVGSGGGLPGLVLAIARPDLQLTLIESNHRKSAFLVTAAARLQLANVEVLAVRAESAGRDPARRDSFDLATARAVAAMPALVELCLPLLRTGGRLLAMKAGAGAEVASAAAALAALSGRLDAIVPAPSGARSRGEVVIVSKLGPTPAAYPRRPGAPSRRPLGI